jgi:hypothetical protein
MLTACSKTRGHVRSPYLSIFSETYMLYGLKFSWRWLWNSSLSIKQPLLAGSCLAYSSTLKGKANMFLRNVGWLSRNYVALYARGYSLWWRVIQTGFRSPQWPYPDTERLKFTTTTTTLFLDIMHRPVFSTRRFGDRILSPTVQAPPKDGDRIRSPKRRV